MILEAVEDSFRLDTNQPQVPRRGYPIEHVLPQAWTEHWPVEDETAEYRRAAHVHRLGNLTLLTKSLNSKVSNSAWTTKREALRQHDTLLLNSRLLRSLEGRGWTEDDIDTRTVDLLTALTTIWPVPVDHQGITVDPRGLGEGQQVQLRDLVVAGLVPEGTVLTPRSGQWEGRAAVVRSDGLIEIDGRTFDSPSGAGKYAKGGVTNGWYFWRLPDGRTLRDVRSSLTGLPTAREASSFNWTQLHTVLEGIPAGHWTTYGTLAEVIGTAPQAVGNHVPTCSQCSNAYRVLRSDGSIATGFIWTDPNDTRDPLAVLEDEGLSFASGKADAARRLTSDQVAALLRV